MGNCCRLRGNFPEVLVRSIAESSYGRAKIFAKCSQDAVRFYEINPLFRLIVACGGHVREVRSLQHKFCNV